VSVCKHRKFYIIITWIASSSVLEMFTLQIACDLVTCTIAGYQYYHTCITSTVCDCLFNYIYVVYTNFHHNYFDFRCASGSEASWMHSIPPGLAKRLKGNVLVRTSSIHVHAYMYMYMCSPALKSPQSTYTCTCIATNSFLLNIKLTLVKTQFLHVHVSCRFVVHLVIWR
jgi:hypothetical protein